MHARRWINVVVQLASDPGTVCDDVATAPVRISLLPPLTVVVGVTAAATWDRVCPESSIANVPLAAAKYSARMRIHQHLILLSNAFTNCTIACAILGQTPPASLMDIRSWFSHHDQCKKEDYQTSLNLHFDQVRVCVCKVKEIILECLWEKKRVSLAMPGLCSTLLVREGRREGYRLKARMVVRFLR